ncbi:RNA polymerase sigma factor [Polaribacter aestuariivivens]|uniref:RNA polymerase sigma factor n=1 Tax=Polaribacter aestuariivivens TaxID=2304626 RepID=A0A5S3N8B3_9FLAO|nr:RNA polymerase sigma factor [Polaribacter aestuariivivens]TMM31162.1 RNA polymerase sigma factor [Polaribacter aestuariivivens]
MNKKNILSDKILIKNYQKGDKKMISLLVEKWHVSFCKVALWIVKDADIAKDIAQESWRIILKKLPSLKEPEKFKSWAISIINRKAIDFIRAKNREHLKLEKIYFESEKTTSIFEITKDDSVEKKLLKSIKKLSVEHQMVIELFYKESYSLKEISEILKISVGTTKSRLFHAREKLKTILKHRNYER